MSNVEEYKNIPGVPSYSICLNSARVRNDQTGHILKQQWARANSRYYWMVTLRGQRWRVHRLVAAAGLERRLNKNEQVCHKNSDQTDNCFDNLRVGTAMDNSRDRIRNNTNGRILRNADVREIRLLAQRMSRVALAERYGVTPGHIYGIISGRSWGSLP
jgi:hypothetical protein